MGKMKTKKLVQGAMVAALFGCLSLINTYTGSMFDIFICYGMVIPLVWYGYHYSFKDNCIVSFVSMIVIMMVGVPYFVISAFSACLSGLFIGEALKRKAKKETILLGTLIVSFINNLLLYEVFSGLLGINLIQEMKETYMLMSSQFPQIVKSISEETFLSFAPLVLLMTSVMEMYVVVLLCQLTLKRLSVEFPGSFHIASMHLSKRTGIILVVGLLGSMLLMRFNGSKNMYFNYVYLICLFTLALQGLAFLSFYVIVNRKTKWIFLIMLGFFIPVVNTFYVAVGIGDIFSEMREKVLYNNYIDKE